MNTNNLYSLDVLDILFSNKNKSYGAYYLRRTYYKRLLHSLYVLIGLVTLVISVHIFKDSFSDKEGKIERTNEVHLVDVQEAPPDIPPPPPPPQKDQPKVEIKKFTEVVLAKKNELKPEELKPVDVKDLVDANIGAISQEGIKSTDLKPPPPTSSGAGENFIFTKVEIEPEPNGGKEGWQRYLRRNLNSSVGADNGAPPGKYTVTVTFVVEKDGHVTDVRVDRKQGYGMDEEALRVVKSAPAWTPGQQNGKAVRVRYSQNITFVVEVD